MRGFGGLTPKGREQVGDLRTLAKGLENLAVLCEVGNADAWLLCGRLEAELEGLHRVLMPLISQEQLDFGRGKARPDRRGAT